jgi:hypothetical protein
VVVIPIMRLSTMEVGAVRICNVGRGPTQAMGVRVVDRRAEVRVGPVTARGCLLPTVGGRTTVGGIANRQLITSLDHDALARSRGHTLARPGVGHGTHFGGRYYRGCRKLTPRRATRTSFTGYQRSLTGWDELDVEAVRHSGCEYQAVMGAGALLDCVIRFGHG